MSIKSMRKLLVIAVVLLIIIVVLAFGFNAPLTTTEYSYTSSKIPEEFDGYRIVLISDYHNKDFGDNQEQFISAVESASPDIIVLTGDIVDEDHADIIASQQMTEGVAQIAPVYYITGNHELEPEAQSQYEQYKQVMHDSGVVHLDNLSTALVVEDAKIILTGQQYYSRYVTNFLEPANEEEFNILLYHGSDNFDLIAPLGYDLVLSGHAHGGIVKIPFLGGLFDNEGGFFPKYDSGVFENGDSTLISSSGVGDADIPRFNNPPEIVVISLYSE